MIGHELDRLFTATTGLYTERIIIRITIRFNRAHEWFEVLVDDDPVYCSLQMVRNHKLDKLCQVAAVEAKILDDRSPNDGWFGHAELAAQVRNNRTEIRSVVEEFIAEHYPNAYEQFPL